MNRTKGREEAFKLLYQIEIQKNINKEQIDMFLENNNITQTDTQEYITDVVMGIDKNIEAILKVISNNIKKDWKIERISKINLALLKLAVYEINYNKLPFKVVINEVVELAKKYGEETSSVFINGVLASVVKENL